MATAYHKMMLKAHMWLNLAASGRRSNPSEEAVTARDTVAARMTPDDLSEAQRRARELETAREAGRAGPGAR